MLKQIGISWLLLFIFSMSVMAQEKPYSEPTGLNNWYVELGGSGYLYSLNYEKILYRSQNLGWVGRVGLGYNNTDRVILNKLTLDGNTWMVPFTMAALIGDRERKEKIELGGGFTLLAKGVTEREVAYCAVIGFRVIETNKVVFRASFTPIIDQQGKFVPWFGISLGRNFSLK